MSNRFVCEYRGRQLGKTEAAIDWMAVYVRQGVPVLYLTHAYTEAQRAYERASEKYPELDWNRDWFKTHNDRSHLWGHRGGVIVDNGDFLGDGERQDLTQASGPCTVLGGGPVLWLETPGERGSYGAGGGY